MTVFIGHQGKVELQRRSSTPLDGGEQASPAERTTLVRRSGVVLARRSFSTDLGRGFLVSGDRVSFTAVDPSATLAWVAASGWPDNTKQRSGSWFVHIDQLDGIRLYSTFADALNGNVSNAIPVEEFQTNDINVTIRIVEEPARLIAAVKSYELSTNREAIDVTALSEQFRTQYSGLISGSGRLSCVWDYTNASFGTNVETPAYLTQLVTRTEIGSEFQAKFYLKSDAHNPSRINSTANDNIFYLVNGIITNAAVAFQANSLVEISIEFVTAGAIQLRVETVPVAILARNAEGDRILGNPQGAGLGVTIVAD